MALNKFMHPRNIYRDRKPDFKALAIKYPQFRQHAIQDLRGQVHLDFKNPECLRSLSWALLKEDWNLDVTLPVDRLIPTIPLRLNYILWLEDLIVGTEHVTGIDIGTGAACVYPLLAARKNHWKFTATETDDVNFDCAVKNVQENHLEESIKVVKVEPDSSLLDLLATSEDSYTFCMCNPPFFANNLEAWGTFSSRSEKRPEPRSVSTASPTESIFPGGEVQFVKRMIEDSTTLKDRISVYTTMLGKKSSLTPLKMELTKQKITNIGLTEFCQGRTMRWGLAWSFDETVIFPKPPSKQLKQSKARPPVVYKVPHTMTSLPELQYTVRHVGIYVMNVLDELEINYEPEKSTSVVMVIQMVARQNTWSHQRRKRRQKMQTEEQTPNKKNHVEGTAAQAEVGQQSPTWQSDPAEDLAVTSPQPHGRGVETVGGISSQAEQNIPSGGNSNTPNKAHESHKDCTTPSVDSVMTSVQNNDKVDTKEADVGTDKDTEKDGTSTEESRKPLLCTDLETPASQQGVPAMEGEGARSGVEVAELDQSIEDITDYILKCTLTVKKSDSDIELLLTWIDGQNIELMHQVMQFFKNRLK